MNVVVRFPVRRVAAAGMERTIARAFRAEAAERMHRELLALSRIAEMPLRQRLIDIGYTEGAKADVLHALAEGRVDEARRALANWRVQWRAVWGAGA